MSFWVRKSIFGAILIVIAVLLLNNLDLVVNLNLDWFSSSSKNTEQIATVPSTAVEPVVEPSKTPSKKYDTDVKISANAAAEGLSKFYASINPELSEHGPRIKHGVVMLPKPTGDLEKLLEAKGMVIRAFPKTWQGSRANRPFRENHTLYQKLDEYAKQEGLEVIWWLDKDIMIKEPFRINKEILATAYQIGQAMNGHFVDGVSTYFCYKQRDIVLIEGRNQYLDQECRLLNFNKY